MEYPLLVYGDSGSDVVMYQQLLKMNGFFPISTTGVIGPDTIKYTNDFQKYYSLEVTGNVTEETWDKLFLLSSGSSTFSVLNKSTLSKGDQGEEVGEVQQILKNLLYYDGEISYYFDDNLYSSVQSYQFINKLIPDGIVGLNTWSSLLSSNYILSCDISTDSNTYTVVAGDTLYSIAKKFSTSVDNLKLINNLNSDILSIGQVLKLSDIKKTYVVIAGDTLYSIAKKFNTTVDNLKLINNLSSNILSIGQVLVISDNNTYVVVAGDTLYSIAKKFNTTVDQLIKTNNLSSTVLKIGQKLDVL